MSFMEELIKTYKSVTMQTHCTIQWRQFNIFKINANIVCNMTFYNFIEVSKIITSGKERLQIK